jgi:hypothetical protein
LKVSNWSIDIGAEYLISVTLVLLDILINTLGDIKLNIKIEQGYSDPESQVM